MYYGNQYPGSMGYQQPAYQKTKTCGSGHLLSQTPGEYRNYPSCNSCGAKNLISTYACAQCNFDLCQNCYSSPYGNVSGYSQQQGFQNYSEMGQQKPAFQSQGIQGMTSQSGAYEYKMCPNKHFLTLCDSKMRYYPTCNVCGRTNVKNSWTCFNCDWDMCLTCYDSNNIRPTEKVKVCDHGHLLVYTDKYKRPNVICNKCGKSSLQNQYSCFVCDYDECMECYEGRAKTNCTIF